MKCLLKISVCVVAVFGLFLNNVTATDCNNSESPLTCHGSRVIRNLMHHVLHEKNSGSIKLVPGLEISEVATAENEVDSDGRSIADDGEKDDSFAGRIGRYLQTHELKIKFPELLERSEFKDVIQTALKSMDEGKGVVEGRKKDKGGLGLIMMMGMMMAKMMGALGLGGVGLLAMKALGVSMMALLLAAIIGIKKLAEGGHDDGGHHVQYVTAHGDHHRRRRQTVDETTVPLPYKGWSHYAKQ